jgi:hypothetical protein
VATLKLDEPRYVMSPSPGAHAGATANPSVAATISASSRRDQEGCIVVTPTETAAKMFQASELECMGLIEEQVTM